ncbi:MAG: AAA family ATPase [Bacteroidota bacterium]
MQLNQELFKRHFQEYADYCNRSQWLSYNEGYKFRFGRWLNERVDIEKHSDEEILETCKESQNQVYQGGWPKGVNFIISAKRFRDEFITLGDIQVLRKLWKTDGNLSEEALSNRSMSFPKLSVWAGILIPEKFKILARGKLMNSISYLFDLTEHPKSGFNGFQLANNALNQVFDAIETKFPKESDKLIRLAMPEVDEIEMVDKVWLTQDFNLYLFNRILEPSTKYFWVNQTESFPKGTGKGIISNFDDGTYHHQSLKEMKEGDVIIHHVNKKIIAISRVTQEFQIIPDSNSNDGAKKIEVGVTYSDLESPISDEEIKVLLSQSPDLTPKNQSPFDKNLNVAQGYCYPISKNLFDHLINPDMVKDLIQSKNNSKSEMKEISLNQILYGPPGTGKTYYTVNKALEIIHGPKFTEGKGRGELIEEFNRLREKEQIGFVSFHQSFGYEDFIEGIMPKLPENENGDQNEDGEVKYELKEGIFKKMCRMAKGVPSEKVSDENHYDFENARYFKMSIGGKQNPQIHDWCIKNEKIALGWGHDANFHSLKKFVGTYVEFRDHFKEQYPHLVEESTFHIQATHAFLKMKKGDVVIVPKGNKVIDAIGIIKDDEYIYDDQQDFEYYQFRNVNWIATNLNASPDLFVSKNISQQTIYEFYDDDIKKDYFKRAFNFTEENSVPENYVLIIDEINRGNVAAIFGELITLIEQDKRMENSEAMLAKLPYSKEWFGVPSNLFMIGTMNTADRSVEALDTALRRRFSFKEMLPKPDLLTPQSFLFRLLWDYWDYEWDDPDYKVVENQMCHLFGVDESFHEKKYKIWEEMEKEGFHLSQINKFNDFHFSGINLADVLRKINTRIEVLVDRDHSIGHSYFMTVKSKNDLRLVFKDKILPLLQEYFFGDFGKIGLVLGQEFVEKVPEEVDFAKMEGYEDTSHLQKERFRIKIIDDEFPIIEALSQIMN